VPGPDGTVADHRVAGSDRNTFQARYVVSHPWLGTPACPAPEYGRWVAPEPPGWIPTARARITTGPRPGTEGLGWLLRDPVHGIALARSAPPVPVAPPIATPSAGCSTAAGGSWVAGVLAMIGRRRR
jgi:hypothetical protein